MLTLTAAFSSNPRVAPLAEGAVKPQGIDLQFVSIRPSELFFRNLSYDEFDVSEMSISEYLMTREQGNGARWDWSALPLFLSKGFMWLHLYVNSKAGIQNLSDLRGKRVGIPDYPMTSALWMRIFLKELCGIEPQEITWYQGRTRERSHAGLLGLDRTPPQGVKIHWLTEEQTPGALLDRGELDAAYGIAPFGPMEPSRLSPLDRYGDTPIEGNPNLRPLFSDFGRQVIDDFYRKTGVFPCNHTVIVKNRVLREHPWAARELFAAFQRSKELAYQRAKEATRAYLLFEGEDSRQQAERFGQDPYPLGLQANRKMLQILTRGSFEQGLTASQAAVEDLFFHTVRET